MHSGEPIVFLVLVEFSKHVTDILREGLKLGYEIIVDVAEGAHSVVRDPVFIVRSSACDPSAIIMQYNISPNLKLPYLCTTGFTGVDPELLPGGGVNPWGATQYFNTIS